MNGPVEQIVSYKEWVSVCDALGAGRQHLLLRKGGIHEGREGFSFKHESFVLFPTRFHAQAEQIRVPCEEGAEAGEWQVGDLVTIRYSCQAIWAKTLTDWEQVCRLEPYHVWSESLVRERFDCGEVQQIHCALVRVSALPVAVQLPYEKKYGGCRTWVDLPWDGERIGAPVLSDEAFAEVRAEIEAIAGAF